MASFWGTRAAEHAIDASMRESGALSALGQRQPIREHPVRPRLSSNLREQDIGLQLLPRDPIRDAA